MIELDEVKKHLRVIHDDEDDLIKTYLHAAISTAEQYLNRSIIKSEEDRESFNDLLLPPDVRAAILLIVGGLYANREDEKREMPMASRYLLNPHRINMGV